MNTSTDVMTWLEMPIGELLAWYEDCGEILRKQEEEIERNTE